MKLKILIGILFLIVNNEETKCFNIDDYTKQVLALSNNETLSREFNQHLEYLLTIDPKYFDDKKLSDFNFNCEIDEGLNAVAESVHKLRPSDVKIVAALGDSLTAALGAKAENVLKLIYEYRGISWSIGGDDGFVTMPNILKMFSQSVSGYSQGKYLVLLTKKGVGLNAAVSGQESNHIPDQARLLIQRIKKLKNVDWKNDWKLVTLFIGGNDLCDFCKDKELHSPASYIKFIEEGLDLLHKELPRTFVNLVMVLNINEVKYLNRNLACTVLHKNSCPCGAFPKSDDEEKQLTEFLLQYQNYTDNLVNSGKYDTKDDFTVVVQPFFKKFDVPKLADGEIDYSYFAPDCFHFSTKSHATAAVNLWNNMLQPVGNKSTAVDLNASISCPTKEQPYFFTNKNSNL